MGDPALCLEKCMCRSLRLWNSLGIQVNALTSLSFLFLFFRPAVGGFLSCGTSTGACTSAACSSGISGSVSSSSASATTACHGRVRLFPPKLTTTWYLNRSTCTSVADCSSPSWTTVSLSSVASSFNRDATFTDGDWEEVDSLLLPVTSTGKKKTMLLPPNIFLQYLTR